jgi:hypothetical protein
VLDFCDCVTAQPDDMCLREEFDQRRQDELLDIILQEGKMRSVKLVEIYRFLFEN